MAGERIAFYGTLLSPYPTRRRLGVEAGLELLEACRLPGRLYRLGHYPGYVPGPTGEVVGELWEILDWEVVDILDRFEGFDHGSHERSRFVRRRLTLLEPQDECWVYTYEGPWDESSLVASGDWLSER